MPCPFCEVGACINPDHGVVRTFDPFAPMTRGGLQPQSQEPQVVKLFDIQGSSFRSGSPSSSVIFRVKPSPSIKPTPSIIVHGVPFLDYMRMVTAPPDTRVRVTDYLGGWEKNSQIVKDAKSLYLAWEKVAKEARGAKERSEPEPGRCSGEDWQSFDEGMDVAEEIADVDSQHGRSDEGVTLWRAYRFPSEPVGILITQIEKTSGSVEEGNRRVELGIRWLVGHPTIKGGGAVLMAKADELHKTDKYKDSPMHVTAAASSIEWYQSKGFTVTGAAECNDDGPCGCAIMEKPAPAKKK